MTNGSQSQTNPPPLIRGPYPELTWTAVILGNMLGALIALSVGYASLTLGVAIEGSELAAILGFGFLRGVLKRRSIVENNISQTIASAVNGASAGMMFSVPAIFILGYQADFNPVTLTFGAIAGAFLGIAFIVPLRQQRLDFERLTFPAGIAVASVLKTPASGLEKVKILGIAALLTATAKYGLHGAHISVWPLFDQIDALLGPEDYLPAYLGGTFNLSFLALAVAFIAGRSGLTFVLGACFCYWVMAPLLDMLGALPVIEGKTIPSPDDLRATLFRPTGIGMLIGAALVGFAASFPLFAASINSLRTARKTTPNLSRDQIPVRLLAVILIAAVLVLAVTAVTSAANVGVGRGILMAVLGSLWVWVAVILLSEAVGRTNWSPLSGMTLIAVTLLILITQSFGGMDTGPSVVVAITVGAALCIAMSQSTDLMLDLKTGYLVGASPRKQYLGQFLGAWLGPILMVGLIFLMHEAYTIGSDKLPAPHGKALASMISSVTGGTVPSEKYGAGALLGGLMSALQSSFGIAVGLGFYMPFNTVLTYGAGTLLREIIDRTQGPSFVEDIGIPVAAGLLLGEAMIEIGLAVAQIMMQV